MDGLHAKYPGKFFFCSETCVGDVHPRRVPGSATAQHRRELHPGQARHLVLRQQPGLLDDERGVRAEEGPRPRVLAGRVPVVRPGLHRRAHPLRRLPGQGVLLRRDRHGGLPEGRLLPVQEPVDHGSDGAHRADELDRTTQPGQDVAVWVYANVATVELFLNGTSLGAKSFDQKVTTFGRPYLETTEPTGDDYNYPSGSYTSPNGSTGKLHLTWTVPFQPGTAHRGRDPERPHRGPRRDRTAGQPQALTLTPGHAGHRGGRDVAVVPGRRGHRPGRRAGARRRNPSSSASRARHARRGGQRPPGERAELPGILGPRLQRPGAGHRHHAPRRRQPGRRPHHGHRELARAGAAPGDAPLGGGAPGSRADHVAPRGAAAAAPARPAGRPAAGSGQPRGRRELLGRAGHGARGDAGRRPDHRLVELLRQGAAPPTCTR